MRLSLFEEHTRDMLISQTTTLPGIATPQSVTTNVDKVRNRGVELAWQKDNVLIRRLELFGSTTYVDSKIAERSDFRQHHRHHGDRQARAERAEVARNLRRHVPADRCIGPARWPGAIRARFSRRSTTPTRCTNVYQAFDPYLVFDTRIQYKVSERGSIAFGIDNLTNEKYFLFHPFPQRTYVVQGKPDFLTSGNGRRLRQLFNDLFGALLKKPRHIKAENLSPSSD